MKKLGQKNIYLFLFLTSVLVMLFATKSSPLYPFNDWTDANAFFTTGKSMFQGKVLYRDLYEHKGPFLYVLHGLAWLVSKEGFLGVWLIEIAACYFFLLYSYRIICLFSEKESMILMPLYAAVVYAANHMRHGDSAEELCLPFLAYGLYVVLKALKEQKNLKNSELLAIGITSGCVLWIKYTMLGFYLGWIVLPVVLLIRKADWKQIGRVFTMIGIGVVITTIPVLIYFIYHGAIGNLFEVYFYNNLFVYSGESLSVVELTMQTIRRIATAFKRNFWTFGLIALGEIWLFIKKQYTSFLHILLTAVGLILTIIVPGTLHGYYTMCFSVYACLGICAIWDIISGFLRKSKLLHRNNLILSVVVFSAMICFVYLTGYNSKLLLSSKDKMPQYQFAKIIEQDENPTLLNYGCLDGGFYTVTGIVPTCKYFHTVNMELPEMDEMQQEVVSQGRVQYVITRNQEYEWPLYEKVAEAEWPYENKNLIYYLYRLKQ